MSDRQALFVWYGQPKQFKIKSMKIFIVILTSLLIIAIVELIRKRKADKRKEEEERLDLRWRFPIEFEHKGKHYCSCGGGTTEVNYDIDIWKKQE